MTKIQKAAAQFEAAQAKATAANENVCKLIESNASRKQIEAAEKQAKAAEAKAAKAAEKLAAAQAAKEAATQAEAETLKEAAKAEAKKLAPALVYIDRVRVQKSKLQSISKKFNLLVSVYDGVLNSAKFADFLQYMKNRHKIETNETPRRGWSDFYAVQFAEKHAKAAAADNTHADYAAARAYLLNEKLAAQAISQAEREFSALYTK